MSKIKMYQKPTCSKCRTALKYLKEKGVEFESINYYETPYTVTQLTDIIKKMGVSPWDVVRKNEQEYKDLQLSSKKATMSDNELITLMVQHPNLIQRPIIVDGAKVVLGRTEEALHEIA